MDPRDSPFEPGAGTMPPILVGREDVIEQFSIARDRLQNGRSAAAPLMTGPRGMGKTVLMNHLDVLAREHGWFTSKEEVNARMSLPDLIAIMARDVLLQMSALRRLGSRVQQAFGVLKAFASVSALGVKLTIDADAISGRADSGIFDRDLRALFVELGEVARDHGTGVLLSLDELHTLSEDNLDSLNGALHRTAQEGLPVMFLGAGLFPSWQSGPERSDPTRVSSYAARMYAPTYVRLTPLGNSQARRALVESAKLAEAKFSDEALDAAVDYAEGSPWLLQMIGSASWKASPSRTIKLDSVNDGRMASRAQLDQFFYPRVLRSCDTEQLALLGTIAAGGGQNVRLVASASAHSLADKKTLKVASALARRDVITVTDELGFVGYYASFTVPGLAQHLERRGLTS